MFDGTGHVHDVLEKFYNFAITQGLVEQQIISLLFTHLKRTAVEWYAAEVGKVSPTKWDQVVASFGSHFGGTSSAVGSLNTIKLGKGHRIAVYFTNIMRLQRPRHTNVR